MTTTNTKTRSPEAADNRAATLAGLRALVRWLEAHPAVPLPFVSQLNAFVKDPRTTSTVARELHGFHKSDKGSWLTMIRDFGGDVVLHINWPREAVCTKRVVGTKTVPEHVIPAHTEEIIVWDCLPLLTAASETARDDD